MAVKRKRSVPDFSPSPTLYTFDSITSSPNSSYTTDGDIAMGDSVFPLVKAYNANAAHAANLHSRTRKRFRDGRPDEDTIHRE